jgi:hypothetical protein
VAGQFLQAMAGVESMTAAINPADNSLIVVIGLLLFLPSMRFQYALLPPTVIERGRSIGANCAQNRQLTISVLANS